MTGTEQRQLSAHPTIAMLTTRRFRAFSSAVGVAILAHRKQLDGSSYPRGVRSAQISPLSRVLILAKAAPAFFKRRSEQAAQWLSLLLCLSYHKFDRTLVQLLLRAMAPWLNSGDSGRERAFDLDAAVRMMHEMAGWRQLASA